MGAGIIWCCVQRSNVKGHTTVDPCCNTNHIYCRILALAVHRSLIWGAHQQISYIFLLWGDQWCMLFIGFMGFLVLLFCLFCFVLFFLFAYLFIHHLFQFSEETVVWTFVVKTILKKLVNDSIIPQLVAPNDTIWRHGRRSILVRILACCLFGNRPLPKTSAEILSKNFSEMKKKIRKLSLKMDLKTWISKCSLFCSLLGGPYMTPTITSFSKCASNLSISINTASGYESCGIHAAKSYLVEMLIFIGSSPGNLSNIFDKSGIRTKWFDEKNDEWTNVWIEVFNVMTLINIICYLCIPILRELILKI